MKKEEEANLIVPSAIRWANNILVEIIGNYAEYLPEAASEYLREATAALAKADRAIRLPNNEIKK